MTATKTKAPSIFRYVEAINSGKTIELDKDYNQFMTVKAFSMHADSITAAAELNRLGNRIPDRNHFGFLAALIAPRKRFGKWPKVPLKPDLKKFQKDNNLSAAEAEAYAELIIP